MNTLAIIASSALLWWEVPPTASVERVVTDAAQPAIAAATNGFIKVEADPTVPAWAKSATQPLPPNYNTVSNRAMNAATDNAVVKLTGNQTITGYKTFTDDININHQGADSINIDISTFGVEITGDWYSRFEWPIDADGGYLALLSDIPDISGKADKCVPSSSSNLAALDANGDLTDSGKALGDFALADSLAPAWVYGGVYDVGDLCTSFDNDPNHMGTWLYKCMLAPDPLQAMPPETDSTHWELATVEDVLAATATAATNYTAAATNALSSSLSSQLSQSSQAATNYTDALSASLSSQLSQSSQAATNYANSAIASATNALAATIPAPGGFVAATNIVYRPANGSSVALTLQNGATLAANISPDGQSVFAHVTPAGTYFVAANLTLVGYGTWPTNSFQAVFWRVGSNYFANVIRED